MGSNPNDGWRITANAGCQRSLWITEPLIGTLTDEAMAGNEDWMKNIMLPPRDFARDLEMIRPQRNYQLEAMYDLIDSVRSAPRIQAESVQAALVEHVKSLQSKLGPDQELLVTCSTGTEVIRVMEIVLPNWHLMILIGVDGRGNATSIAISMQGVQLTCKVIKVEPQQQPVRIGFVLPDPIEKK